MKLFSLLTCLTLSIVSFSQADSTFVPGYYVLNSNAEYSSLPNYGNSWEEIFRNIHVVEMTKYPINYVGEEYYYGSAFENHVKIYTGIEKDYHIFFRGNMNYNEPNLGEVLIVYEYLNGIYKCFDLNFQTVFIKGLNALTKVQKIDGAGIGKIIETIELIDGNSIKMDNYYWVISQNTTNSTVKIQIADGKIIEIPQSKIKFYDSEMNKKIKNMEFRKIE